MRSSALNQEVEFDSIQTHQRNNAHYHNLNIILISKGESFLAFTYAGENSAASAASSMQTKSHISELVHVSSSIQNIYLY